MLLLVPPPTEPDPYVDEAYRLWAIKQTPQASPVLETGSSQRVAAIQYNDAGAWPTVALVTVGNIAAIYRATNLID